MPPLQDIARNAKNIFFSGGSGLPYSVAKLRYFYDLYKITANRNFLYPYFSE